MKTAEERNARKKANFKKWQIENKEHLKLYRTEYNKKNILKIRERKKKYYYKTREKRLADMKKYRDNNKEKTKIATLKCKMKDLEKWREKRREYSRRYYFKHKNSVRAAIKKWRLNNPDKVRAQYLKRRKKIGKEAKKFTPSLPIKTKENINMFNISYLTKADQIFAKLGVNYAE